MSLSFTPLAETLGAEVRGLDLHSPIDDASAQQLREAFDRYGLLLVRDTDISSAEQIRYGEVFGRVEIRKGVATQAQSEEEGTQYISNVRPDGMLGNGELSFHQDHLFHDEPLRALMLCAIEIPPSGSATKWRSGNAIFEALEPALRERAESVRCFHAFDFNRGDYSTETGVDSLSTDAKTAWQPLVWRNPRTGLPAVWSVKFSTAGYDTLSKADGDQLLDEIWDAAESVEEYVHHWRTGDLLIWNNLALQHARLPFESAERRTLRRTPLL